jgi:hypothetical protein
MSLTSRMSLIARLAIALFVGFFITSWTMRRNRTSRTVVHSSWAHIRRLVRDDFIDYFSPIIHAVKEFQTELHKND